MAYTGGSIVDYLKSIGKDSSVTSRIALGKEQGIDYSKTTTNYGDENTKLLDALRNPVTDAPTILPKTPLKPPIGQTGTTGEYIGYVDGILTTFSDEQSAINAGATGVQSNFQYQPSDLAHQSSLDKTSDAIGKIEDVRNSSGSSSGEMIGGVPVSELRNAPGTGGYYMNPNNGNFWNPTTSEWQANMPQSQDNGVVGDSSSFINQQLQEDEDKQQSLNDVNDVLAGINDDQDKKIETLTRQQKINKLSEELGLDPETLKKLENPAVPDYADVYAALRSEQGVTALEQQINSLDSQIADLEASARQGSAQEGDRLAPMEIIGTRQKKLETQANEKIDNLRRQKQTAVDQLQTKQALISDMMKYEAMAYDDAAPAYQDQFNRGMKLADFIEGEEDDEIKAQKAVVDAANANLAFIKGIAKDRGLMWDDMDTSMKNQISKLELQAGMPSGTMESFMKAMPDSELLHTSEYVDDEGNKKVSFIYKDANGRVGVTETVDLGATDKGSTTEPGDVLLGTDADGNEYYATPEGLKGMKAAGAEYEETFRLLKDNLKGKSDAYIKSLLSDAGFVTTSDKDKATTTLYEKIDEYMKEWKVGGDKVVGTREHFIEGMMASHTISSSLTEDEIKNIVYNEKITNDWMKENDRGWFAKAKDTFEFWK